MPVNRVCLTEFEGEAAAVKLDTPSTAIKLMVKTSSFPHREPLISHVPFLTQVPGRRTSNPVLIGRARPGVGLISPQAEVGRQATVT